MRFKKTIKRMVALGTGATLVGATIFGASAANLADYPSQYIQNGKFTGVMVVGDNAAAADVVGVSDIAVSLQAAATVPAGSVGSEVVATGDAWRVGTSTKILELSENLESGATAVRESIATITTQSFIDDTEMPGLLASGTTTNPQGDAPYEQRLYFEDTSSGYVQHDEDDQDVTGDFLYFPNGRQIARYELEFTTALESDIDDSSGSSSTTGDFLTDLEDVDIQMLGQTFSIVLATRNGNKQGQVDLTLMGGAIRDTLLEGNTKTYTIDGQDFETTLEFVSATQAKFTVNGESTQLLADGETDKLSDGTTVGVSEILYQDYAGGVHSAEFFLGAQKIEIKDTNINDTASSNELQVDDDTIDGADVKVEGTDDNTEFKIDRIVVNMTADDDYYVPVGGKLSENPELEEPELLFGKSWDITYEGLTEEPMNEIKIRSASTDDYDLHFVDGDGNEVKVPLAHTTGGTNLKLGDNDDSLVVQENKTIRTDDYFFISDESDEDGERNSYVLRYKRSDAVSDENADIVFDVEGSSNEETDTVSEGSTQQVLFWHSAVTNLTTAEMAQIKIGGGTFRVYNASSIQSDDWDILVDMNGDNSIGVTQYVTLNTQFGAKIDVQNQSVNSVIINVSTPNTDDTDDLTPSVLAYNLTAASGEVALARQPSDQFTYTEPEDDDDNGYTYTAYGAFVQENNPSDDPNEITIWYPEQQRVPQVFIVGDSVTFTQTASGDGSGGAVQIQKIDVGATKLASEVADITAVNSILVGGPCANAAANEVMGNPADCTEGFTPDVGVIHVWDVGAGNTAMLVAGFSADDTRNAAAVVASYDDYASTFKGERVEVRKVNSVLTVSEPTVVEEEAEEEAEEGEAMEDSEEAEE